MAYGPKILDHFENPRNVGSLDKNSLRVGTGIVGAPECFSGDTLIAIVGEERFKKLKDLPENQRFPVWSFNLEKQEFEINWAKVVCSGNKEVQKIQLSDGGFVWATPDHKFLVRPDNYYIENKDILNQSIWPFKRYVDKRGYWRIRRSKDQDEYRAMFKFLSNITSLDGLNIHHKNEDKRSDFMSNLELLSISKHQAKHNRTIKFKKPSDNFCERLKELFSANLPRHEIANNLDIFTDELYYYLSSCNLTSKIIKTTDENRKIASDRMKKNNPYHNFTESQKLSFAKHCGNTNGRWINITNECLINYGKELFKQNGKITTSMWIKFAKDNGLPRRLNSKSRFRSWLEFKELCSGEYNHTISSRGEFKIDKTYTLQVEENNNYVVLTRITKNVHEGIVVKNCGDVMKLQIEVDDNGNIIDSKFKCFGCGSALASSSLATEWLKGRTIEGALEIKNTDIVKELALPPVKIHCSVLAEDAIRAAIADYKKKQEQLKQNTVNAEPTPNK